jgi:acyl-CoA thioester hydrolase
VFRYSRRVHFYETDAQGVVHHSNYFRYFEEARGELLRSMGFPYSTLRERGLEVVLLEARCEWKRPLFYDEEFAIEIELNSIDRFTFSISYTLTSQGTLRALGFTKHCVVKEGRIVSIPPEIREAFVSHAG